MVWHSVLSRTGRGSWPHSVLFLHVLNILFPSLTACLLDIVAYLLKARTVKPAETAVTVQWLANKHVSTATVGYNSNGKR
jgi:hypothetical protein